MQQWIAFKSEPTVNARNRLATDHLALVARCVTALISRKDYGVPREDLEQVGAMGLMEAVERYEPQKNCKFSTYASRRIVGKILDYLRVTHGIPRLAQNRHSIIQQAKGRVEMRTGRRAQPMEISKELGLAQDDPQFKKLFRDEVLRVAVPIEIEGENDFHAREECSARDEIRGDWEMIDRLLDDDRQKLVIHFIYVCGLNMHETGRAIGISESRVSQIHGAAIRILRSPRLRRRLEEALVA